MRICDLKPGMSRVDIEVEVVGLSEPRRITMSNGAKRDLLELKVKDETGTIALVLWDDKVIQGLKKGDRLKIRNGFVTSYRAEWRINVGKYVDVNRSLKRKIEINEYYLKQDRCKIL